MDDNGNLTGIVTINVDENLKKSRAPSAPEADLILLSMGFLQPEHYINDRLGMEVDDRGNFKATKDGFGLPYRKCAAADCRRGRPSGSGNQRRARSS